MHYHKYYPVDVVNGPGTRATLFVSGCEHRCPGCYNASTWPVESGRPFDDELADRIIADLNDTRIRRRGLSLSGGIHCTRPIWLRSGSCLSGYGPSVRARTCGAGPATRWPR